MSAIANLIANAHTNCGASKHSGLAAPAHNSMRRYVAGPGLGLWWSHYGRGNPLGAAASGGPRALAANASAGRGPQLVAAALGAAAASGSACTPGSSQTPCPARPGHRSHSWLALLGAGVLQPCRPAGTAPACNAATASTATACRPVGPDSDAAPARHVEPQHQNAVGSPLADESQLQTHHASCVAPNSSSSSSSSWSGQVHRDQQSGGSNGNGTRRQPQGEATAGQAAASVRLPPPHSSLAGSAWGHGAPALGSGRLQVWWTPLDVATTCSPTATARNRGCITPAEAAEVGGSKSAEVAAKRTAARALARTVLARAVGGALEEEAGGSSSSGSAGTSAAHSAGTGSSNGCTTAVSPQDLRFARNSHGKPHLVAGGPGWPVLRHNLTHTHDLAGVAVLREPGRAAAATGAHASGGTSGPDGTGGGGGGGTGGGGRVFMSVGLDVERLDRAPRDPMALARRRLAAAEVRDLEAIKDAKQRARHFMWLWTLKEAYVKARGTGINAPPGLKGFAIGFKEMPADQQLAVEAMCGPSRGAAPRLAAITITHCAASPPPPAASAPNPPLSAARAAEAAHGAVSSSGVATTAAPAQPSLPPAPVRPQSQSLPDADVGTDAQFHFLLFQPTPAHVGALCIATQQQQQQQSPAATALSACGASSADSDCVSDASSSGSDCSSGGGSSGSGSSGTCWAALVEHWWCVPLEGEAQLLPHELTLLGCTADAAKAP